MKLLRHIAYLKRYWSRHGFIFGRYATPRKFLNFCIAEREAKRMAITVRSHPWELFIDPVNICPLTCPLCATGMRLQGRNAMILPYDHFTRYIDQLAPWLFKIKLFNYGEPFLNPDLFKMIMYAHKKNIAVQVNSNGNIWKEEFAGQCITSGLDILVFALDGLSADTYTYYRKGGSIEKVLHTIASISTKKKQRSSKTPEIILQYLMQAGNEHEYSAIAEYARDVGATFFPQPLTFDITDPDQRQQWLPADDNKTHYDRELYCKKKNVPERGCGFLWNNLVINVDGGISPCCHLFFASTDFGNLENESFDAIWNNYAFQIARQMQHLKKVSDTSVVCGRCLNEQAFTDTRYDLVNEYRTNLLQ